MGAIAGILICDYWVIRKQKLSLKDLYLENGLYSYDNGFNWRAVAAFVLAIAPVVPGFLRAATMPGGKVDNPGALETGQPFFGELLQFADTLYTYAWFVTFGLAFVIYLALMWKKREKDDASS